MAGAARKAGAALLCAALCLLSACWVSQKPLITGKNAAEIAFTGTYRSSADGEQQDLTLRAAGPRAYEMADAQQGLPVRFMALRGGWYVIQYQARDEDGGHAGDEFYLYQPVRFDGATMRLYSPECADTPGSYKGMKRDDEACEFSRPSALKSAALAYIARLEKGELDGDVQEWTKIANAP